MSSSNVGVFLCALFIGIIKSDPILTIKNGQIKGLYGKTTDLNKPYMYFRGIPYALPPVGNLRFMPPVPANNWNSLLDATKDGNMCVQAENLKILGSEDCLFINVYSPKLLNDTNNEKLPVMAWIHGGGFIGGSSGMSSFNPDLFLEQGIVFVSFNYRLGIFGFLSTNDLVAPGNYGLKDQVLALKWVRNNIEYFGGDPERVTIFGESAGAASVSYMLQIPSANGLFKSAISQSGTSLCQWALGKRSKEAAEKTAAQLFINTRTSENIVNGLRKVNFAQLQLSAGFAFAQMVILIGPQDLVFTPVIEPPHDTAAFTGKSHQMLSSGNFIRVPYLIGFNSNEFAVASKDLENLRIYLATYDIFPQRLVTSSLNPDKHLSEFELGRIGNLIKFHYFGYLPVSSSIPNFIHYGSDAFFVTGTNEAVKQQSKYTDVYYYQFTYEGRVASQKRDVPGVGHAEDLSYLFRGFGNESIATQKDLLTRKRLIRLWTNFAKFRNPTPEKEELLQNIIWPKAPSSTGQLNFLNIGDNLTVEESPHREDIIFWENIYSTYGGNQILETY